MSYLRTAMLLAAMTALFMGIGYLVGGQTGMVIALARRGGDEPVRLLELRQDGACACMARARSTRARRRSFTRSSAGSPPRPGCRCRASIIMDNPQPNAFATGRNPQNAAVAVTTGLLNTVNQDELAGVIAHELGHIKHRDTLLMTITATLAGAISMLANFGFYFGGGATATTSIGPIGALMLLDPRAARRGAGAVRRSAAGANTRPTAIGAEISRQPLSLASALREDRGRRAAHPQHAGRAQSGLGASLHRQPAVGRAHGQSLLDPPQCREPRRAARRDRRAQWARAAPSA